MPRRRRFIFGLALAATATLAIAGCTGGSHAGAGAGALAAGTADYDLIEAGVLTTCSDIPHAPFEFEDAAADSGYAGFDIEVLSAIAERLGLVLHVEDVTFEALASGSVLLSETCDVGASAMTITDERRTNLDFSEPYYDVLQSLLVRADSDIESIGDLDDKTVGVQPETTAETFTTESAPAGTEIIRYSSDGELWSALQAGQLDAILQDHPVNLEHERDDETYMIVEEYDIEESYGFAFAKGEKEALVEAVNAALQDMQDDGTYQEIYDAYFTVD